MEKLSTDSENTVKVDKDYLVSVRQADAPQTGDSEDKAGKASPEKKKADIKHPVRHRVFTIIGVVLCVILIPIIIINCTLMAKQFMNQDEVPSVGGYFPMVVLTDSMAGTFDGGSLIICKHVDAKDVQVDDIICYFDPSGSGTTTTTHRVIAIDKVAGEINFVTKGDANNTADSVSVPASNLVGKYLFHIPGLGNLAMFMQSTPGLIIFVVLPIILLVVYDVVRRRKYDKEKTSETDELVAELEALRAEKDKKVKGEASLPEQSEDEKSSEEEKPKEEKVQGEKSPLQLVDKVKDAVKHETAPEEEKEQAQADEQQVVEKKEVETVEVPKEASQQSTSQFTPSFPKNWDMTSQVKADETEKKKADKVKKKKSAKAKKKKGDSKDKEKSSKKKKKKKDKAAKGKKKKSSKKKSSKKKKKSGKKKKSKK